MGYSLPLFVMIETQTFVFFLSRSASPWLHCRGHQSVLRAGEDFVNMSSVHLFLAFVDEVALSNCSSGADRCSFVCLAPSFDVVLDEISVSKFLTSHRIVLLFSRSRSV